MNTRLSLTRYVSSLFQNIVRRKDLKVVPQHRWGLLHANMKSRNLQNLHWVSGSLPAFRGLVGMQILPMLCLSMRCDSLKCWVFQPLLEDFRIMPWISLSRKQLSFFFFFLMFPFIIHSKALPIFFTYISPPLCVYPVLVFLLFPCASFLYLQIFSLCACIIHSSSFIV